MEGVSRVFGKYLNDLGPAGHELHPARFEGTQAGCLAQPFLNLKPGRILGTSGLILGQHPVILGPKSGLLSARKFGFKYLPYPRQIL